MVPLGEGVFPIHPPIGVHWRAFGTGTIGVGGVTSTATRQGAKATCTAAGTPVVKLEVTFAGSLAIVGPPPKLWNLIDKYITVGLSGTLVIVDGKVPGRSTLSLTTDAKNSPVKLTEAASLTSEATLLRGSISGFARLKIPQELQWVLVFIDELPDWDVEKVLFSWNGWPLKETIVNISSHDIQFVKK